MRTHLVHGSIAALVSAAVSAGAAYHVQKTSKHAWPDLTAGQKEAFAASVKGLPFKIDIASADGASTELAYDLDDAFEDAGVASQLDRPLLPLPYGISVAAPKGADQKANDAAEKVAGALKAALGGRYDVPIVPGQYPFLIISIGKRPR